MDLFFSDHAAMLVTNFILYPGYLTLVLLMSWETEKIVKLANKTPELKEKLLSVSQIGMLKSPDLKMRFLFMKRRQIETITADPVILNHISRIRRLSGYLVILLVGVNVYLYYALVP